MFDLTLEEEKKKNGTAGCADAYSQLLFTQLSGPQATSKHRGVNKVESVATSLSGNN